MAKSWRVSGLSLNNDTWHVFLDLLEHGLVALTLRTPYISRPYIRVKGRIALSRYPFPDHEVLALLTSLSSQVS